MKLMIITVSQLWVKLLIVTVSLALLLITVVSVYLPIAAPEMFAAPEKFAARDLSAVVTFESENVSSLLIEMRV